MLILQRCLEASPPGFTQKVVTTNYNERENTGIVMKVEMLA